MVEHPAAAADIWQERYRAATVLAGFEPSSRSEADMPIRDPLRSGDFAVVMEMENAIFISWSEVGETLRVVAAQVGEVLTAGQARLPQVIFVHAGEHGESAELLEGVRREAPRLFDVADVQCVSVPDGRYYELKNAGLAAAARDVIVLLDSDTIPEAGWLRELVAPFADEGTIAASGHTYLGHSTFVSRTLAMVWVFPLRDHDAGAAQRRALNVNNCALRAAWFRAHPFPIDHGFKVSCTKFMRQMNVNGVALLRPPAYAKHAPLTGWRFLVWRALVTGRDADRKYTDMKPTFDRRAALERAIRSVQQQTLDDYEHIIVDDGSHDGTDALVRGLDDPRIRFIRFDRRQGANAARNAGIDAARSELVTFLDSDDEYLPHRLASTVALATQRQGIDLLISSFQTVKGGRSLSSANPDAMLSGWELELVLMAYGIFIAGSAITACRMAVKRAGGFDPAIRRMQDREMLLRMIDSLATCRFAAPPSGCRHHVPDRRVLSGRAGPDG